VPLLLFFDTAAELLVAPTAIGGRGGHSVGATAGTTLLVPSKEVEDEPGGQGGCSVVALAETTFLAPSEEVEDEPIDFF
jgi:hypothetical protein